MNAMIMHVIPLNFSLLSPKTCDLVSAFLRAVYVSPREPRVDGVLLNPGYSGKFLMATPSA